MTYLGSMTDSALCLPGSMATMLANLHVVVKWMAVFVVVDVPGPVG